MLLLFTQFNDALAKIKDEDLRVPKGEVGKDETVLVTVDDPHIQRLYTFAASLGRDAIVAHASLMMASADETPDLEAKATELRDKAHLVGELMWVALKDRYKLWGKPSLGLRAGWKVIDVSSESGASDEFAEMLGRVLGGKVIRV